MNKISGAQMVTLLFICRVFNILTLVPSRHHEIEGSAGMLGIFLSIFLFVLFMIPAYVMFSRNEGCTIIDCAGRQSKIFAKIISIVLVVYFLVFACETIGEFEVFLTRMIYPQASSFVFLSLMVLAVVYGVYLGLEAISRFSFFVFFAFITMVAILICLLFSGINTLGLVSPFYDGVKPVISVMFRTALASPEIVALMVLYPFVRGNKNKSYITWVVLVIAFIEIITFLILTIMDGYAYTQMYPVHALTSISEISELQRSDILHVGIWVLVAYVRSAMYLYLSVLVVYTIARKNIRKQVLLAMIPICFFLSWCFSKLTVEDKIMEILDAIYVGVGVLAFLLPLIILIWDIAKNGKKGLQKKHV